MTDTHPAIQLLAELVALPSINPEQRGAHLATSPFGEGRVVDFVERTFEPLGLAVERMEVFPGRPNAIVRLPGSEDAAAPVVLEAHMDTVDVEGMIDPFVARVEEGRLYARGACDTKGSLAAMMHAFRQVARRRQRLRRPVWLVASADEEYSQRGIQRFVASGARPAAAVVGEPTGLRVIAAHRGQVYLRIHAHGRAAHTSVPERGINAVYDMAEVIQLLRARVAERFPGRVHPLCGPPLLTISIVSGGTSECVVPDHCQLALDLRVVPGQTAQDTIAELRGWIDEALPALAPRVSIDPPHLDAPPLSTPVEHPLVRGLSESARAVLGVGEIAGAPYNTDAGWLSGAGVPTVVFGPGDIAQAHTTNEFVELQQVTDAATILERFLLGMAG